MFRSVFTVQAIQIIIKHLERVRSRIWIDNAKPPLNILLQSVSMRNANLHPTKHTQTKKTNQYLTKKKNKVDLDRQDNNYKMDRSDSFSFYRKNKKKHSK